MKALTVLLVLLLSTPAYACTDPLTLATVLFENEFEFAGYNNDQAVFIDTLYQSYIIVEIHEKQACVVEEGVYL